MRTERSEIRSALKKEVFNGTHFSSADKRQVLNRIKASQQKTIWFPKALATVFSLILLLSVGYLLKETLPGSADQPAQNGTDPILQEPAQNEPENAVTPEPEEEPVADAPVQAEGRTEPPVYEPLFELTSEEKTAFDQFSMDLDTGHLEGLEPLSIAKLYATADYNGFRDIQYALLTDRENYGVPPKDMFISDNETEQTAETRDTYESLMKNLVSGEIVELTEPYEVAINFQANGQPFSFGLVQNEDGIWQVRPMPLQ